MAKSTPAHMAKSTPAHSATTGSELMRLGFARGTAPSRWARRWQEITGSPLALVPQSCNFGHAAASESEYDVLLERCRPGEEPPVLDAAGRKRHSLLLYTETLALVVAKDHPLAKLREVTREQLRGVTILPHADHCAGWPLSVSAQDAQSLEEAMQVVAAIDSAVLLPLPLARHVLDKGRHAVIPIATNAALSGSQVWATWSAERPGSKISDERVQTLIGVLRGRTARSSRTPAEPAPPAAKPAATFGGARGQTSQRGAGNQNAGNQNAGNQNAGNQNAGNQNAGNQNAGNQNAGRRAKLKPNSRGAQLAAAAAKRKNSRRKKSGA